MNNEKLNLNSIIKKGKYNGKTIKEIINEDRKEIINMVKRGYSFEEEVYEKARYKHHIRDSKITLEFVDKSKNNNVKPLSKDTEKLEKIIESLSTIGGFSYIEKDNFDDEKIEDLNLDI